MKHIYRVIFSLLVLTNMAHALEQKPNIDQYSNSEVVKAHLDTCDLGGVDLIFYSRFGGSCILSLTVIDDNQQEIKLPAIPVDITVNAKGAFQIGYQKLGSHLFPILRIPTDKTITVADIFGTYNTKNFGSSVSIGMGAGDFSASKKDGASIEIPITKLLNVGLGVNFATIEIQQQ
ncbi:MAG: hypothetical protein AABY53_01950 [Bdellovibrionota bacterium]